MISQIIHLSNNKSFNIYREKYNYSLLPYHGLYGFELRNIPSELFGILKNSNESNIFHLENSIFITGSIKDMRSTIEKTKFDGDIKSEVLKSIEKFEKYEALKYKIGRTEFDFNYAYSMGILNITPDSFSDGGKFLNREAAVYHAMQMIEAGVDIIDIGGESTRPGSEPVSEESELKRVIPVIKEILGKRTTAVLSVDTTKAKVADEALKNGALIVNDISGGTFDPAMLDVVKEFEALMVIMHIKGKPQSMQISPGYKDVIVEVYDFLARQCESATKIGIHKIIIDPGIGFGKRTEDNLKLLDRLEDFKSLGFPILIGVSRKSFIGNILNLNIEDRDNSTNVLNAICLTKGARVIRSHNFVQAVQTCKLYNSIITNQ